MKTILRASAFAAGLAVALPAFAAFTSIGIPDPELVGDNCDRFTVNGVEWAIDGHSTRAGDMWQFVLYRAGLLQPVVAEEGGNAACAVPGVVHSTNFVHKPVQ